MTFFTQLSNDNPLCQNNLKHSVNGLRVWRKRRTCR